VAVIRAVKIALLAKRAVRKFRRARRGRNGGWVDYELEEFEDMEWSALKSKTVWFGIVQAVMAGALVIMKDGVNEASVALVVTSVVTVVLRAMTDKPLSEK
jgi:hypothetical protein